MQCSRHFTSSGILYQLHESVLSYQKSFLVNFQPHHDHLLPWQLSHRTDRPPLSFLLSLALSLFLCCSPLSLSWLPLTHQSLLSPTLISRQRIPFAPFAKFTHIFVSFVASVEALSPLFPAVTASGREPPAANLQLVQSCGQAPCL